MCLTAYFVWLQNKTFWPYTTTTTTTITTTTTKNQNDLKTNTLRMISKDYNYSRNSILACNENRAQWKLNFYNLKIRKKIYIRCLKTCAISIDNIWLLLRWNNYSQPSYNAVVSKCGFHITRSWDYDSPLTTRYSYCAVSVQPAPINSFRTACEWL